MASIVIRFLLLTGIGYTVSACVRHSDMPVLQPVGSPVNPAQVSHVLCSTEAQAMYEEGKRQYRLRARMAGYYQPRDPQEEEMGLAAADRKYSACLSAEGYRSR